MIGFFDKKKFAELLNEALGGRSGNEFGREIGVSGSLISRRLRSKMQNPPDAITIQRIAGGAANGVTYEQLMKAAGYLDG